MKESPLGLLSIDRVRTAERVAEALREQLLSGAFAPGTPMRDVELSAQVGVSRTTMREALALLAREGLLSHAMHRGMEVTRLTPADVHDIYAARRVLERAGIEALLADPTPSLAALERALATMADATERQDMRRVVEADVVFHTAIVAASGIRRLLAAETGVLMELRLALSVTDRAYDDDQLGQHRELLGLINDRRPDAVSGLDRHLTDAASLVAGVLGEVASDRAGRRGSRRSSPAVVGL